MKIKYVVGVALDLELGFTVGITKKKGPAFLLNKLTFPGGKVEGAETPEQAMSREMLEETGLSIHANRWSVLARQETEDYSLTMLMAQSDKVLHARTSEEEPVWHLAINQHLVYAKNQPEQYAPDFIRLLEMALAAASLEAEPLAA